MGAIRDLTGRGRKGVAPVGRVLMAFALVLVVACVDHGPAGLQAIADEAAELRGGYGFLVAVIDGEGGRTVAIAGTDATGAPLTEDVTWRIGSVTKALVAVVIMQLVDEGRLSLDDSAAMYVNHDFIPAGATVFDLLHHSSGIRDYVEDEEWVELMRSCPDEAPYPFDFVAEGPLFEPGSEWRYSNTNYLILGEIIEMVTGLPPEIAIRHRIIEPLGLTDTYTAYVETGRPPVPAVADFFDAGPGPIECDTAPISGVTGTDGGMVSSVDDLNVFYRALFAGELISDESLHAMTGVEYVGSEVSGHGLGLIHLLEPPNADVDIWANGGGVVGYRTLLLYDLTSDTTVIVMTPTGHDPSELEDILRWAFG
jgi:D-alanyl-D-alanine carboxypeptidase